MKKGSSGFSLLEIIIVLALIGILLAGLARFKQKQLQQIARQHVATAVVQEMYGFLKFVNEDEVAVEDSTKPVINPLYTKNQTSDAYNNVYYKRVKNTGSLDPLQSSNYLSWSGTGSKRSYFTNAKCDGSAGDPTSGQSVDRRFEIDYIRCKLPEIAINGNMQLERIDLVGSAADTLAIDRVDYIVKFVPDVEADYLYFESFKPEFDEALAAYKFNYSQATVLRRAMGGTEKDWTQMLVNSGGSNNAINFGSVSSHTSDFSASQNYEYAIRFSFETGIGKYAKADGSIGVDKLCWNLEKSMKGPCIKANNVNRLSIYNDKETETDSKPGLCWDSGYNKSVPCLSVSEGNSVGSNGDDRTMHLTTDKNGKTVTGTLMANLIIENNANVDTNTNLPELLTVPITEYRAFGSDYTDAKTDIPYDRTVKSEAGTMKVKALTCPTAPGGRVLSPRLVAAISSVAADVGETNENVKAESDFSKIGENRSNVGAVGRLAGVALQVNLIDSTWTVSATQALYDNLTGEGINLVNSKSISVVLTSWCSTVKQ